MKVGVEAASAGIGAATLLVFVETLLPLGVKNDLVMALQQWGGVRWVLHVAPL